MSSHHLPAADEVLSVIRNLSRQHAPVELTKTFRGIVIRQDVNPFEVNPGEAAFRVTSMEMCAALEGDVTLHSRHFPRPVTAHIRSLDMLQGTLVLSGFAYAEAEWKKRDHERVRPGRPTYITLRCRGRAVRACLENLSVEGVGALAFGVLDRRIGIQPGVSVLLDFALPPDCQFTALRGKIVYLKKAGLSAAALGIRLFPRLKEARLLENYVASRKQEIFEELHRAYWELSRPRGVESLYF